MTPYSRPWAEWLVIARDTLRLPRLHRRMAITLSLVVLTSIALSFTVSALPVLAIDVWISRELQERSGFFFQQLLPAVSVPGYAVESTVIAITVALLLAAAGLWLSAVWSVVAFASSHLLSSAIKLSIQRPRPPSVLDNIGPYFEGVNQFGFPSGHVFSYLAFFGFLSYVAWRRFRPRFRWPVIGVCGSLIVLVGPSRVYLGAHWASDVVAGYLMGGLWLVVLCTTYRRLEARFFTQPEPDSPQPDSDG